jgi:hypothetical protein
MTARCRFPLTLLIHRVGFQYRTRGEEEDHQNLGMYRLSQFK